MPRQVDYIIINVTDMSRSVAFYRNLIGLALKFESPDWTEFMTGQTTLALHGGNVEPGSSGQFNSNEAYRNFAGTGSVGFAVEDIEEVYESLKSNGVHFLKAPADLEEGLKIFVASDPDGFPITFSAKRR